MVFYKKRLKSFFTCIQKLKFLLVLDDLENLKIREFFQGLPSFQKTEFQLKGEKIMFNSKTNRYDGIGGTKPTNDDDYNGLIEDNTDDKSSANEKSIMPNSPAEVIAVVENKIRIDRNKMMAKKFFCPVSKNNPFEQKPAVPDRYVGDEDPSKEFYKFHQHNHYEFSLWKYIPVEGLGVNGTSTFALSTTLTNNNLSAFASGCFVQKRLLMKLILLEKRNYMSIINSLKVNVLNIHIMILL